MIARIKVKETINYISYDVKLSIRVLVQEPNKQTKSINTK